MIQLETWVRRTPAILLGVGAVDLAKQLLGLYAVYVEYKGISFDLMDESARFKLQAGIADRLFSAVIFPATWLAYAAFAAILLGIYDRMKVPNA